MQFEKGLLHHKCTYTYRVADTLRERRHVYGVRANTTAIKSKSALDFAEREKQAYIGDHDSGDRTEEDGVPAHER
jgi:hypothetical protein